jgi:hypothetical protein
VPLRGQGTAAVSAIAIQEFNEKPQVLRFYARQPRGKVVYQRRVGEADVDSQPSSAGNLLRRLMCIPPVCSRT